MVIVVFPLNALMRDQLQKLERSMNVCILQCNADEEKVAISKDVDKRSLVSLATRRFTWKTRMFVVCLKKYVPQKSTSNRCGRGAFSSAMVCFV